MAKNAMLTIKPLDCADMKKPYYNLNDRMIIRLNVTESNLMLLKIAWLKLCRELERSWNRSKFFEIYTLLWGEVKRSEQLKSETTCLMCGKKKPKDSHSCCEDCGGIAF